MKATWKLLAAAAALALAWSPLATAADGPPNKAVIAFLGAAYPRAGILPGHQRQK